jgi:hypothetical protein
VPYFPPDLGGIIGWGGGNLAATTVTRFLWPWYGDELVPTAAVQIRVPRPATLRRFYVRHNTPIGNGNAIVYTLRVNGVATAVTVSLASTGTDVSNLVNSAVVAAGDLVDIVVTKAVAIGNGNVTVTATIELGP